jgi:hypothetical protein
MRFVGPAPRRLLASTLAGIVAAAVPSGDVAAQDTDLAGVSLGGGLMIRNLRPSGQPVAPIFDGWYNEPDGSISLCYGYHSLNLEEDVDVPLGPDNFVEPSELDGAQPTHFDEVPPEYRRHFCAFTVSVENPEAADAVVWTLTTRGVRLSARATGSPYYRIDEEDQPSRAVHAPRVAVLEPVAQAEVRGRSNRIEPGTGFPARVDERVPLLVRAAPNPGTPAAMRVRMLWTLHRGPGAVAIEEEDAIVSGMGEVRHSTGARFSKPGEYVLRLQAVDWTAGNPFGFQCCFTTAFVRVSVRE